MNSANRFHRVRCSACDHVGLWNTEQWLARLRELGHLRREKRPTHEMLDALREAVGRQIPCNVCGAIGLQWEEATDDFDDAPGMSKQCDLCHEIIPPERLEIFPQITRCARCQDLPERPGHADDFCPRCGGLLVTRAQRTSGIARYERQCAACRYRGS